MNIKTLLLLFVFIVSGCVSVEFVRKDLTPTKQAILRYYPPSSEKSQAKANELIKKEATEFCGGEYTVTKEYQALGEGRSTFGVGTGFGVGGNTSIMFGGANRNETMYNYVEVLCK